MEYFVLVIVCMLAGNTLLEIRQNLKHRKNYPLEQAQKAARGRGFRAE